MKDDGSDEDLLDDVVTDPEHPVVGPDEKSKSSQEGHQDSGEDDTTRHRNQVGDGPQELALHQHDNYE